MSFHHQLSHFINKFKTALLSYSNQSTILQLRSMDWFLYEDEIGLKLVNKEHISV